MSNPDRAPRVGASEASFDTTTVALLSHSCPTAAPMLSHCCMKSKARFPFTYRTGSFYTRALGTKNGSKIGSLFGGWLRLSLQTFWSIF